MSRHEKQKTTTRAENPQPTRAAPLTGERISYACCVGLLVLAPAIGFVSGLAYFGYSLSQFTPAFPNDQTGYFLQAQAFCVAGFNGGYFTIDEKPAPAPFSRMGVHGPAFPILFGTLGRCFGMTYVSGPIFNVLLLGGALAIFCALTRPSKTQLLCVCLLLLTYWPYYSFVYSWMQETTHFAIAVTLAGVFSALLNRTPVSKAIAFRIAAIVLVCFASLIRISWALMLPPLFVLFLTHPTWRWLAFALGAAAAGVLGLMTAFRWICAPYLVSPNAFLMNKLVSLDVGPRLLWQHISSNLHAFRNLENSLELTVIYEHLAILAALFILGGLFAVLRFAPIGVLRTWALNLTGRQPDGAATGSHRPPRNLPARQSRRTQRPTSLSHSSADETVDSIVANPGTMLFCGYNQLAITLATVMTYFVSNGGSLRVFSVHLLLTLLVACVARQLALRYLFLGVVGINLLMSSDCLESVSGQTRQSFSSAARTAAFHDMVKNEIVLASSPDGWDNTVLSDRLPGEFAGMTPGIGVSFLSKPELLLTAKSRYVIASPALVERVKAKNLKFLRTLNGLTGGALWLDAANEPNVYLNLSPSR